MSSAFPDVYGTEELPPTSSLNDNVCIQTFKKHPEKTIQQAKKRNTDCANKILWSGYYPWEYPEKDLFKIKTGRKTICYTKNQLLLMNQLGIFPKQIKKPKLPTIQKLQYNSSPISNLVSPHKCIDNLNIPVDNIHMYVVSNHPYHSDVDVLCYYHSTIQIVDLQLPQKQYHIHPNCLLGQSNVVYS